MRVNIGLIASINKVVTIEGCKKLLKPSLMNLKMTMIIMMMILRNPLMNKKEKILRIYRIL